MSHATDSETEARSPELTLCFPPAPCTSTLRGPSPSPSPHGPRYRRPAVNCPWSPGRQATEEVTAASQAPFPTGSKKGPWRGCDSVPPPPCTHRAQTLPWGVLIPPLPLHPQIMNQRSPHSPLHPLHCRPLHPGLRGGSRHSHLGASVWSRVQPQR